MFAFFFLISADAAAFMLMFRGGTPKVAPSQDSARAREVMWARKIFEDKP